MNGQSQAQCGPLFLSFGDLHMQTLHAKKAYKLTDNEFQLLQCFIQAMPRPSYKTHLTCFVKQDVSFWISHTGIQKTHIYKAFRSLGEKRVIISVEGLAKIQRHALHPSFAQAAYDESIFVDKPMSSDGIGHSRVTELVTGSDGIGHSRVTELVTGSDGIGHTPSYIEIPSVIPRDSLSIPSRNPAVDNVDNFEPDPNHLNRLSAVSNPKCAKSFLTKLRKTEQKEIDAFLDYIAPRNLVGLGDKQIGLIWGMWSDSERDGPTAHRIEEMQSGL